MTDIKVNKGNDVKYQPIHLSNAYYEFMKKLNKARQEDKRVIHLKSRKYA